MELHGGVGARTSGQLLDGGFGLLAVVDIEDVEDARDDLVVLSLSLAGLFPFFDKGFALFTGDGSGGKARLSPEGTFCLRFHGLTRGIGAG